MSLTKAFKFGTAGDTIVEVMIVLAVLGLAISISYATANRSLLNTRQAQENSTATELVQAQIEQLRTMLTDPSTPANRYIFQAGPYCLDHSNPPLIVSIPGPYPTASCEIDSLYDITITYTALPGAPTPGGTFKLVAQWPDVQGRGNDTVTLVYRLYQP